MENSLPFYAFTFFANFFLAVIVFSKNKHNKKNILFTLFILCIIAWLVSLYLYYYINNCVFVLWMGRFNFAASSLMPYLLLKFVEIFPKEESFKFKYITKFTFTESLLLFIVAFFTPLIAAEELVNGNSRTTVYGSLYIWFIIHFVGYTIANIFFLIKKLRKSVGIERLQIKFFILGITFAVIFGSLTNIFIPLFTGYYDIQNLGPVATLLLVGFITYAIMKTRFLDIRFAVRALIIKLLYSSILFGISVLGLYVYSLLTKVPIDTRAFILIFVLVLLHFWVSLSVILLFS